MASPRIIPKKSVISKVPAPSDLANGEVAINYADQVWYGKHPTTSAVVQIGASYLHSSTHGTGGSDSLSPSDIGAVAKSGDTMTGKLIAPADTTIAKLNIGNALSGVGAPSVLANGDVWISNQNKFSFRSNGNTVPVAGLTQQNIYSQPQTIGSTSNAAPCLNVGNTGSREAAVFSAQGSSPAVRITQTGTGEALRVEDETTPDSTAFVVSNLGRVGIGVTPDSLVAFSVDSTGIKFGDGTIQTTSATAHRHDQLISLDDTAELELQNNGSIIVSDAAVTTTLAFSSSTGRTLTFPDKDGTIALLSDVAEDISADSITFDATATETEAVAKMFWNTTEGGLQVGLAGGNVQLQIGSMLVAYVRNDEATTLNKGEVVYLYGASGNRASVRRASNAGDATSSKTIGVVAESIAPNQIGFIVTQGVLDGLALGSPYQEGDSIYLGDTAGTFTRVKPTQPNHIVFIGVVERANAGNGQLYIKPQNGFELEELHDVLISSPQNNQTILYNSAVTLWQNATITTGTISGLTAELANKVEKESTDSTPINVLRALTQAEYDSIVTKDPFTIYFIKQ